MKGPSSSSIHFFLRKLAKQYAGFFIVSGIGLLIAVGLLWLLVHLGNLPVGWANAVADTSAATFVFFASRLKIFDNATGHTGFKYMAWLAWQIIHIMLISSALTWLTHTFGPRLYDFALGSPETLLKVAVTPLTMTLNFIVARLLLHSDAVKRNT